MYMKVVEGQKYVPLTYGAREILVGSSELSHVSRLIITFIITHAEGPYTLVLWN